jgi:hypoxanthine phosphoribosyltransferase
VKKLLTEEEIRRGVTRLARELNQEYRDQPLTIVGILTGCVIFVADLARQLEMPLQIGFIQASSYRGETTTRGDLKLNFEMLPGVRDRHVLLVDDIFDTGHTLKEVIAQLRQFEPRSVRSAVLLRKAERREVDLRPDHVVFDIPDEFVVGYGLDYNDHYRNLPYLAVVEEGDLNGTPGE